MPRNRIFNDEEELIKAVRQATMSVDESGRVTLSARFFDFHKPVKESSRAGISVEIAEEVLKVCPSKKILDYQFKPSKQNLIKKLESFFESHSYSKEQVTSALKRYCEDVAKNKISYPRLLIYYISKNGISQLADDIENYKPRNPDRLNGRYSG